MSESIPMSKPVQEPNNLTFDSVIGPILYTQVISDSIIPFMANNIFEFFIPLEEIKKVLLNIKNYTLIGNNVYQSNSSLVAVCLHMGIIIATPAKDNSIIFSGSRFVNVFDHSWQVNSSKRTEVASREDKPIVGATLLACVTQELNKFEAQKSYEIKSRASNKCSAHGFAIIYGEPCYSKPVCIDSSALECLLYAPPETILESESRWMRFGFSGEPMRIYNLLDFTDKDQPVSNWVSQKFKHSSLYLDTDECRFELTAISQGKFYRFSVLSESSPTLFQIKSDGSPIKDEKKKILLDSIEWHNIIWGIDSVTINGQLFGPLKSVFWAKRKRSFV